MDLARAAFRSHSILHLLMLFFLSGVYFFTVTFLAEVPYWINLPIVVAVIGGYFSWKHLLRPPLWRAKKRRILAARQAELGRLSDLRVKDRGLADDKVTERTRKLKKLFTEGFTTWVESYSSASSQTISRAGTAANYGLALKLVAQGAKVGGLLSRATRELSEAEYLDHKSRLLRIIDLLYALGETFTDADARYLWSYPELLEHALAEGHDVDEKDPSGRNDLMALVGADEFPRRWKAALELIVARTRDIDAQDKKQRTALILATQKKHTAVVKRLLVAGADPHLRDASGRSALRHAHKADHDALIRLLEQ